MSQEFNEQVFINGSADETQVRVQAHSQQVQPLQTWETSTGNELARLTANGKLQIGDLGLSTPEALVEASADLTATSPKPARGIHALGRFTGALTSALTWVVHEMELIGTGGVSLLQTALRVKITNNNTGTVSNAELRAGDFQAINQKGGSLNNTKQMTAIHAETINTTNAWAAKAVAVEATINNDGGHLTEASAFEVGTPANTATLGTLYGFRAPDLTQGTYNYAIHTGQGVVHFGDHQELKIVSSAPAQNPPTDFIKVYPKLLNGVPVLYAKNANGSEYIVGSSGALNPPISLTGTSDAVQLLIKGNSTQTNDLVRIETNTGGFIAGFPATGALIIHGRQDGARLIARGSAIQTVDIFRLEKYDGTPLHTVTASGAQYVLGQQSDTVQFTIETPNDQSADLLQLKKRDGTVLYAVGPTGATRLEGRSNTVQLTVRGGSIQMVDIVQVTNSFGDVLQSITAQGALRVNGTGNEVQLIVKESPNQSTQADIQQWRNRWDEVQASLSNVGKLTVNQFRLLNGTGNGKLLISDADGNATWSNETSKPFRVLGSEDNIQLYIKGNSTQTTDLLRVESSSGDFIAGLAASGALAVYGQNDSSRFIARGSLTQTADMLRLEQHDGTPLHVVTASGAQYVLGQAADAVQFSIETPNDQSQDVLQLKKRDGTSLHVVKASGAQYVLGQAADAVQFTIETPNDQTQDILQLKKRDGTVIGGVTASGSQFVLGQAADAVQLTVESPNDQTQDLFQLKKRDGTVLYAVGATGAARVEGMSDTTQFIVRGNSAQTADLVRVTNSWGDVLQAITNQGALRVGGMGDEVQLIVKESPNQSMQTDIQQWHNRWNELQASLSNMGKLTVNQFRMINGANSGNVLTSDADGNASWQPISGGSGTVTSVGLTAPGIFSVANSPVTNSGTLDIALVGQNANHVFAGPSSGGATVPTFRTLVAADITNALSTPPAIGGTTPAAGTFTTMTGVTADSGTTTVVNVGQLKHNSSGTPAANFGTGLLFLAKSSTTNDRSQGRVRSQWVTATDGSRAAKMVLSSFYTTTENEGLAIQASSSGAMIGFLGATPVVRQTGGASTAGASYGATEQSMLQKVYSAMRTYGLLT